MKALVVYFFGNRVGLLSQDSLGKYAFRYDSEWLNDPNAQSISQSLPLRDEVFEEKECVGYFGGLLPEEMNRELIARNLGITARNDYAMLREIGGECAGAVALLDPDVEFTVQEHAYHSISVEELEDILDALPRTPLLAGHAEIRLSLAGAQNKLAIFRDEASFSIPLHESPSSHIIKPEPPAFAGLIENEICCLRLAQKVGLSAAEVEPFTLGKHRCLLVRRYDRRRDGGQLVRLHQEDFCQAMGVPSRLKYQSEGGPTLVQCFELIRRASSRPAKDLITLFEAVLLNVLIGNNDAHAKNFSLLYVPTVKGVSVKLAPLYDLVSTVCCEGLSPKMAMKIGGKYLPDELRSRHWEAYWQHIGFSVPNARKLTLRFLDRMLVVLADPPENEIEAKIHRVIHGRAMNVKKQLG